MNQPLHCTNRVDHHGNPAGGTVHANGLHVVWQNGPLGTGTQRRVPNGAFVEDLISAALQRLHFYQASRLACLDNFTAITHLEQALFALNHRTKDRELRGVEGTNTP